MSKKTRFIVLKTFVGKPEFRKKYGVGAGNVVRAGFLLEGLTDREAHDYSDYIEEYDEKKHKGLLLTSLQKRFIGIDVKQKAKK